MRAPDAPLGGRLWMLAILALPLSFRALLWFEKELTVGSYDWLGIAWDLQGGLLITVLGLASLRLWRWGALVWTLLWIAICHANYEFTAALDLPLDPGQARFLLDPLFLRGSGLVSSHPVLLAGVSVGLILLVPKRSTRFLRGPRVVVLGLGVLLLGVGLARLDRSAEVSLWRQLGPAEELFRWTTPTQESTDSARVPTRAQVEKALAMDLSGDPISGLAPLESRAKNVLLVLLEGASGVQLPSVASQHGVPGPYPLVEVDRVLQSGLVLPHFYAQQRQTHRGEYAVLCGDLPRLARGTAWFTVTDRPWPHSCLPEKLGEEGYETVYLQAAPLPFMMKDQALKRAGFSRVLGLESFDEGGFRTQWGVDDRTLFDGAVRLISELEGNESPWMVTLLTVGTHHPFDLPPGAEVAELDGADGRGGVSERERAFRYLDGAFAEFWSELSSLGLLENTLVVVTSDESVGVETGSDAVRDLSQNVGFAGLIAPDLEPTAVLEPYQQSDLAATILDYLGLTNTVPGWKGRSPLRVYPEPRPVFFANFYLRRTFGLFPGGRLVTCGEAGDCSGRQLTKRSLLSRGDPIPELGALGAWVEAVREYSLWEATPASDRRSLDLLENPRILVRSPYQHLFGGQDLEIGPGLEATMEIEVNNDGGGWVHLRHDFRADGRVLLGTDLGVLGPGDRLLLRYRVLSSGWRSANVAVTANRLSGEEITLGVTRARVEISRAEVIDRGAASDEVVLLDQSLSRSVAPPSRWLDLDAVAAEDLASCLRESSVSAPWRGNCDSGLVVAGPRFYAPMGSRVNLRWTVAGREGTLSTLVGSQEKQVGIGVTDPIKLERGEEHRVVLELVVPVRLNELQAGLIWERESADAWLEVRDLKVEIIDP